MADKSIDAQAARWGAIAKNEKNKIKTAAAAKVQSVPPDSDGPKPELPSFGGTPEEKATEGKSNPKFIYPHPVERIATLNDSDTDSTKLDIRRGYIRRLTEYYSHVKGSSTLANMRCNFQFNPQTISRGVNANYDMQFFFNQSPDQLAQPIPGQSTFSIELLFNREAEVATSMWRKPDGSLVKGKSFSNSPIATSPDAYITQEYDPAWVTEIGVLADLKILDDIIGQGIAQDLINNAAFKMTSTGNSSAPKDATDTASTDVAAGFKSSNLGPFAANIGNKAFLVPTPIRLLISELFMVEGFVMSSQVVFNKFTPQMVPTQALVGLQIQALYFGFAQKNTFLSTLNVSSDPPGGGGGPTPVSQTVADKATIAQLNQGATNYYRRIFHIEGSKGARSLSDSIFSNSKNEQNFNFAGIASNEGNAYYKTTHAGNGGGLKFTFNGKLKIWWDQHITGGGTRTTTQKHATGSTYASGPPPSSETGGNDLGAWGRSKTNPFVVTLSDTPVYYFDKAGVAIFGKWDHESFPGETEINVLLATTTVPFVSVGTDAKWKWDRPIANIPIPFYEDKFNYDLEITITAESFGQKVVIPQKITQSGRGVQAGSEELWSKLTWSPAYQKGGSPDKGRGYGPRTA
jgi:hypothetical protein